MSMSSDDAALAEANPHSEWSLRVQCDRLSKELHNVKRHNHELKSALDMSRIDYKHACEAQRHAQNQLSMAKTDMESLKVHTSKVEGDNSLYRQQLMDVHQSHLDPNKYESNEMLKRMIDTAVERSNSVKSEMDQLRGLYHNSTEENHKMKMNYESKCEELSKVKTDMQILRSHCTAVTQEWQSMCKENQELEKKRKMLEHENEKLSKDCASLHKMKEQELAAVRREKDELNKNHNLVMSERDNVHKEIDTLTERLSQSNTKLNQMELERKQMGELITTYRQEIQAALHDRDQARKHMRELQECVGQVLKEPSSCNSSIDSTLRSRLLDVSRPVRNEVNEERISRGLPAPNYELTESSMDTQSSKEAEMLKEIASLQKELAEAKNEAVISIKRRDWAFSERDKIVQERESIRRQCDELRRERDRAVSNHAEELRALDELKKFKANTSRELSEMREKLDKEERKNKLTAGSNSRDSAIDNDFQDWDTETLEFEIDVSNGYHPDHGLGISFGGGHVSDSSLFVNSITKGSPCEGKLRLNDVLLKVNDVDVTNASKETAIEALQANTTSLCVKVRRKKPIGRLNVSVEIPFNKKDLGLQLEAGVYISKILPGSALAKEGNVAVGDRLLSVNNKSVENKSAKEVMKMMENSSGDYVVLNVGKYGLVPSDSNATSSSVGMSHGILEKMRSKFGRSGGSDSSKHHGVDSGTGTGQRKKAQIGTKQLQNFFSIFKPRPNDEDDDSDTIKVRTDDVMNILDKINETYDGQAPPSLGTDGVDVSTNGTVTFTSRPVSKPAIPGSFVPPNQVYTNRIRHSSGDYINTPRPDQVRQSSHLPTSHSSSDRMSTASITPTRHTPLYEPKVHTLPTHSVSQASHIPADVSSKSKSLEGHMNSRTSHRPSDSNVPDYKPFYNTDSDAHSLDQAVKEMYNRRTQAAKERRPRPISTQHLFGGARSMTPNELCRGMPSSPLRRNRPFTPESPLSHTAGYTPDSRSGSVAGSRSSSSNQMFSNPSNSHRVVQPTCSSPPPPYQPSLSEERFHHRDTSSSPLPPYQTQTLDRRFPAGSSHQHYAVAVRPSSTNEYSTTRVRFPSNHSVSSNRRSMNSNSLEIVSSGRSSPLSSPPVADFYSRRSEEFINSRPNHLRLGKLKEGLLRELELDTSFEHLGITIEEEQGTGIFITSVSRNSLAAEVGVEVGDQIIEFCGINMRTATYDTAASVLKSWHSGDGKVIMKVQYNPRRCKHFPEQNGEVDKNSVTGSIQAIHAHMENMLPYHKKPLHIVHSNGSSSDESRADPPHTITVQRTSQNVGLRLCGGNETGVFVAEIFQESPFTTSDLQVGEEILAINGRSMKGATAEQVATELNKHSEAISMVVQYNIHKYQVIQTGGGDHFYVRAHFKYDAESVGELNISPGDILLVENSLVYGEIGKWYVSKVDDKANKLGSSGVVPSRIKMEESFALRRSFSDVTPEDDSKTSKRNGSIGRRSFFKRRSGRHQHQRSGSKDSRELTSFSDLSTSNDNVRVSDDGAPVLYQRLEKIQCRYPRPVIILGPFAQALIQKLVHESPDKYMAYEEEYLNTENTVIEKEIAGRVFVDYKKVNDLFKVTRTQTLHEIASKNRHSLLMVHPSAIERMHKCRLYPIVIFIKHKTSKQVREVKDPRFLPDNLSSRSAKELFDYFSKIELEFKHLFSVEVQGANMAAMHQNIKRVVDEEQEKHIWL